ncbi:hypothetical protein OH77DRAFT_1424112 [Trametes cingulata]|nr:hypothetical protein OH77DRAFT_1424112 [Trametes cingulata]
MPHSLVVVRLDPWRSSFWIAPSGRLAASKIVTRPFWALRVSLADEDVPREPIMDPSLLYVVSSEHSPVHVPNSTLTLGPRIAFDSGRKAGGDAELTTTRPLHSSEPYVDWPLYVHTAPLLRIHYSSQRPFTKMYYELDKPSLSKFKRIALQNHTAVFDYWAQYSRTRRCWIPETKPVPRQWSSFSEKEYTFVLGALNPPRAYCFDFLDDYCPPLEGPSSIYDEIYIFHQVCRDYRWPAAEDTIGWVRFLRLQSRPDHDNPRSVMGHSPTNIHKDGMLRTAMQNLYSLPNPHEMSGDLLACPSYEGGEEDICSLFTSTSDDPNLPFDFPLLPWEYRTIPLKRPRLIVLEVFGVILDRESAIRRALSMWMPFVRRRISLDKLISRYMEAEAFAERKLTMAASSLAAIVHEALATLAGRLNLSTEDSLKLITSALPMILQPHLYPDVASALRALRAQGFNLLYIPPHSPETLVHLQHVLPPSTLRHPGAIVSPSAASIHFVSGSAYWESVHKFSSTRIPDLQREDVLVASVGIGRVLGPAQQSGFATALVRRPDSIEANVDYIVSADPRANPEPSVVVDSLTALSQVLMENEKSRHAEPI